MISIKIGATHFQLRSAALFIEDRSILLHRLEDDDYWTLPGGRVEPGEDARSTLMREMVEELGETIVCHKLIYAVENFFDLGGQPNHEVGFYFLARFDPESTLHDKSRPHWGVEGDQRLDFRWFALDELAEIDLRPAFLRQSLRRPVLDFEHVVQRG